MAWNPIVGAAATVLAVSTAIKTAGFMASPEGTGEQELFGKCI
jgi:hypothetical protein